MNINNLTSFGDHHAGAFEEPWLVHLAYRRKIYILRGTLSLLQPVT